MIFFGANGPRSQPAEVDHMGIYLGNGWFIQSSGNGVALATLDRLLPHGVRLGPPPLRRLPARSRAEGLSMERRTITPSGDSRTLPARRIPSSGVPSALEETDVGVEASSLLVLVVGADARSQVCARMRDESRRPRRSWAPRNTLLHGVGRGDE